MRLFSSYIWAISMTHTFIGELSLRVGDVPGTFGVSDRLFPRGGSRDLLIDAKMEAVSSFCLRRASSRAWDLNSSRSKPFLWWRMSHAQGSIRLGHGYEHQARDQHECLPVRMDYRDTHGRKYLSLFGLLLKLVCVSEVMGRSRQARVKPPSGRGKASRGRTKRLSRGAAYDGEGSAKEHVLSMWHY
jgi:hypothetical protein